MGKAVLHGLYRAGLDFSISAEIHNPDVSLLEPEQALYTIKPMGLSRYLWKGNYASITCSKTPNNQRTWSTSEKEVARLFLGFRATVSCHGSMLLALCWAHSRCPLN